MQRGITKNSIWRAPEEQEGDCNTIGGCEQMRHDVADKFLDELCSIFVQSINIGYKDRAVVLNIVRVAIGEHVKELLEQFAHARLEEAAQRFNRVFKIDAKIVTNYAPHAKLAEYVDQMKELVDPPPRKTSQAFDDAKAKILLGEDVDVKQAQAEEMAPIEREWLWALLDEHNYEWHCAGVEFIKGTKKKD